MCPKTITIHGRPVHPPSFRRKQRQANKGRRALARRGKQSGALRGALAEERGLPETRSGEAWAGMGRRSGERSSRSWSPPPENV